MSNPWRYRCRVQGVRRVFHPRRVSLSRLHLLRHCERSVQRVGGSCFSLSICCEDPPEHSLCDQGYGLTRQCDPTTMRQIGTPGSPAAAYVVSTPGEDSSRPCSSRKHFWLGIYATTDIFYGHVFVYICFRNSQYFFVKQSHFADTGACLVFGFPSRIESHQSCI
jgi:hypothetical protein